MLLCVAGSVCTKFETGQTFNTTTLNKRSSKSIDLQELRDDVSDSLGSLRNEDDDGYEDFI